MNIACPECTTIYRVDPDRIPDAGVITRCRECRTAFRIDDSLHPTHPGEFVTAPRAQPAGAGAGETPGEREAAPGEQEGAQSAGEPEAAGPASAPAFGPQDPETRARRLARALISDIKVYNPEQWKTSREAGTLRGDFRGEIMKSWEEYVEQVGEEMAKSKPYFRDALNEILAQGEPVF